MSYPTPEAGLPELIVALQMAYSKLARISHPDTRYEDRIMAAIRDVLARVELPLQDPLQDAKSEND